MRTKPKPNTTQTLTDAHNTHTHRTSETQLFLGLPQAVVGDCNSTNPFVTSDTHPAHPGLGQYHHIQAEVSALLVNHLQSAQIFILKVIQNHGSERSKYL